MAYITPVTFVALQVLTAAQLNAVQNNITALKTQLDGQFPIGAIYPIATNTNPATFLGYGTWTAIQGRVLVGAGTSDAVYTNGATGGESTHTLTTAEIASHTHNVERNDFVHVTTGTGAWTPGLTVAPTDAAGGGGAHNNMPPYRVVYIWERTA